MLGFYHLAHVHISLQETNYLWNMNWIEWIEQMTSAHVVASPWEMCQGERDSFTNILVWSNFLFVLILTQIIFFYFGDWNTWVNVNGCSFYCRMLPLTTEQTFLAAALFRCVHTVADHPDNAHSCRVFLFWRTGITFFRKLNSLQHRTNYAMMDYNEFYVFACVRNLI